MTDTMRFTSMPNSRSSTDSSLGFLSCETINSDDTDDDDCQVLGWRPSEMEAVTPASNKFRSPSWSTWEARSCGKRPSLQCSGYGRTGKGYLEPELVEDSQINLRRQWEAATLRRQTGPGMRSEGSEAGTSGWGSRPPQSACLRRETDSSTTLSGDSGTAETAESNGTACPVGDVSCHNLADSTSTDSMVRISEVELREHGTGHDEVASETEECAVDVFATDDQVSHKPPRNLLFYSCENPSSGMHCGRVSCSRNVKNSSDIRYEPREVHNATVNQFNLRNNGTDGASTSEQVHITSLNHKDIDNQSTKDSEGLGPAYDFAVGQDLTRLREKLKQTADFKLADEEEWAKRQLELQKQAQEARRLRKRKRVETDRKNEVEFRQKLRLEEIRRTQQKEEWNIGLKEQLRGKVYADLERLASGCRDMASLLRCLQIPVEGGVRPSLQQVNAAYKKALLRFHPDRVSALAHGDPQRQVEAEETFKLISRMKTTLKSRSIFTTMTAE